MTTEPIRYFADGRTILVDHTDGTRTEMATAVFQTWAVVIAESLNDQLKTGAIADLRQQLAAAQAERDALRALLRRAGKRLWQHHRMGYRLEPGEICPICRPIVNDPDEGPNSSDILVAIDAALAAAPKGE